MLGSGPEVKCSLGSGPKVKSGAQWMLGVLGAQWLLGSGPKVKSQATVLWRQTQELRQNRGLRAPLSARLSQNKSSVNPWNPCQNNSLTIKILKAYDKERNIEVGCADHRLSSVCHTHRSWGYVLYKNVIM